ncbi:MAG: flagellar hook protein FlgE [Trichloromonadaceae bacterium]
MGISSALYSGISGLNTNGNAMSVLGNNIANTNTIGFKASRTVFSDLLATTISGSGGTSQVGRGTQLSTVDNLFSQGTFENTESGTDLAVEGEGFFIVKPSLGDESFFTRAGAFRFNEDGVLVNPEGLKVQGKAFDNNGNLTVGDPSDIRVDIGTLIQAKPTGSINLTTNLDANAQVMAFDPLNPATTSNYATSTRIFDTLGNTHLLTTYFNITGPGSWNWNTMVDSAEVTTPDAGPFTLVGSGNLTFDTSGNLTAGAAGTTNAGELDWISGADPALQLSFAFNTTQYSSDSVVISQGQDGYGAGNLVKISIDGDGVVTANYSNGQRIKVSQIALAKFPNVGGLNKAGGNLYAATDNSGAPRVGIPSSELGKIFTNALEQSNVDLAQEFVKMITTQRGFQASSKIITTTDEMLGELINLKR